MNKGAGILFLCSGNALFLKRSASSIDFPDYWCLPGGTTEPGETPEDTAVRESREELGFLPPGSRKVHTRVKPIANMPDGVPPMDALPVVDFTTFVQKVGNEFVPELNDEHTGFCWAPTESPPEPLHPGCRLALARLEMDELGVARAIAAGDLISPQRYHNIWLFSIRITGTGVSYRSKYDEFVHKSPDVYLTEDFLARCNGLPVIWKHPAKALLDPIEFAKRIVGTVFLPYILGDEVWAVVKIWDDKAAEGMDDEQLSTSPAVYFEDLTVNTRLRYDDGKTILIEGKPSLLDHIAICEQGVWDKGGPPVGVRSESREDQHVMADSEDEKAKKDAEETKAREDKARKDAEEKAKADAEFKTRMDAFMAKADAVCSRMDAWEEEKKKADADMKAKADAEAEEKRKNGDVEQAKADKAKKDAEEKEEKEKADKAKKDEDEKAKADSEAQRKTIADMKAKMDALESARVGYTDEDRRKNHEHQAFVDDIFQIDGKRAPIPQDGERHPVYRRRVARMLQPHSPTMKVLDLDNAAFADDNVFGTLESQILTDARAAFNNPQVLPERTLRAVTRQSGGHTITEYKGDPRSWMDDFAGPVQMRGTGQWFTGNSGSGNTRPN